MIRAIEERELVVPRYGLLAAQENFRVILAQNPFDDVGVGKISRALFDRLVRITMEYQTEEEEVDIVSQETGEEINLEFIRTAVQLVRATRLHPEIKQGSSLRGAIDLVLIAYNLSQINQSRSAFEVLRDAAFAALSGKIWLDPASERKPEEIIEELLLRALQFTDLALELEQDRLWLLKKK